VLRIRVVTAMAVVLAFSLHAFGATSANESAATCTLSVPAQPLESALQAVAHQCAVQMVYFSQLTAGKSAAKLEGQYALDDALHLLLDDSGLGFRHVNPTTIAIRRVAVARSSRSVQTATPALQSRGNPDVEEVLIRGTAQGLVATRIETPLREIPQTFSIISGEQMRLQNAFTLNDALLDAVGLTPVQKDSQFMNFYSRGFQINSYTLDGGGSLRSFSEYLLGDVLLTPDLSEFEHIEVLRGSNALFGADGLPGGAINLVRKRPLREVALMSSSTGGSWDNFRQAIDVTGPLALDGALRGRLGVTYAHKDYFYDSAFDRRKAIFGALDYDVTPATLLTVGGSYSGSHSRPVETGLPLLNTGADPNLPRSTAYTFDWSYFDTQVREAYVSVQQALGERWSFKVNGTLLNSSVDYAIARFATQIDAATGGIRIPPFASYTIGPSVQKQYNVEATLTGRTQWGGHDVQLALGADFIRAQGSRLDGETAFFGPPLADAAAFDPAAYPDPRQGPTAGPASGAASTDVLAGGFASMRLQMLEPWSVIAGLRVSNQHSRFIDTFYFGDLVFPIEREYEHNGKVTPFVGTVFSINPTYSVYASYANIFESNLGFAHSDGAVVDPADGINMEAGVKGAWREGTLNGSLAVYKIVHRGLALFDVNSEPTTSDCCYVPAGRNISKGADLELSGTLAPRWLVGAGYTYNRNRQAVRGDVIYSPLYQQTPRHLLRAWTNYGFSGALRAWSIGGSVRAQSANYADARSCPDLDINFICHSGFRTFRTREGSFAVLSPRIGYELSPRWQVALNIDNVLDKRYYESVGDPKGGNWFGEPRSFIVRLDGRF